MDRSQYPALSDNRLIHLDTSAVFPLHSEVITAVNEVMAHNLGTSGKAQYSGALKATSKVEEIRQTVADFIHADASEIFFVASATDAARTIASIWSGDARVLYSPEDHGRVIHELLKQSQNNHTVAYRENGEYDYDTMAVTRPEVAFLSHMHHLYGSDNNMKKIRDALPDTKLVIDASQSIARISVDVQAIGCDALFFSAQKIGGIAGVGVLYIAREHHSGIDRQYIEPNTLPIVPLVSLQAAIEVINKEQVHTISSYLAKMTAEVIDKLQQSPIVHFTKGPAYPDYMCHGHGIVSFSVEGYSSQDVAMILADKGIQVRAGDHCVDPSQVDQDVVRVSMYRYTTRDDLSMLSNTIAGL